MTSPGVTQVLGWDRVGLGSSRGSEGGERFRYPRTAGVCVVCVYSWTLGAEAACLPGETFTLRLFLPGVPSLLHGRVCLFAQPGFFVLGK